METVSSLKTGVYAVKSRNGDTKSCVEGIEFVSPESTCTPVLPSDQLLLVSLLFCLYKEQDNDLHLDFIKKSDR